MAKDDDTMSLQTFATNLVQQCCTGKNTMRGVLLVSDAADESFRIVTMGVDNDALFELLTNGLTAVYEKVSEQSIYKVPKQ